MDTSKNKSRPVNANSSPAAFTPSDRPGFTLVEMLVVIGIIAILISLLMPALAKARAQAEKVQCMSNMKQIGDAMLIYADENKGFLFPPGQGQQKNGDPSVGSGYIPNTNPPVPWCWSYTLFHTVNPPVMICPSDLDVQAAHSYYANGYLLGKSMAPKGTVPGKDLTYSSGLPEGYSPSDVLVLGEKLPFNTDGSPIYDWYMEAGDYPTKASLYRHGPYLGSNYLMLDMHVDSLPEEVANRGLNPWEIGDSSTTQP